MYNSSMQAPSKRISVLIISASIVVIAVGVNKFWPHTDRENLVTPGYEAMTPGSQKEGSINATAFLQGMISGIDAPTTTDETPATVSRDVAHSIFANTAYMDEKGALDNTSKEAIVADALSQLQQAFVYKIYSAEGLSYLPTETPEQIRDYATNFAILQISMIVNMQKDVAKIEADLGVLGNIYAKEAKDLYELKIPRSLASNHLKIVNNFSRGAAAFKAFANSKNDPLVVPVAMRTYQDAGAEQDTLLRQMAQFFKSSGIIFSKEEVTGYWNAFL